MNDERHGILHLGQVAEQEIDDRYPPIWKRLRRAGASVGVFGSLNTAITEENLRDCTAQHIPQGSLLVYKPTRPDTSRTSISTVDFVPSVLAHFGISRDTELKGTASIRF